MRFATRPTRADVWVYVLTFCPGVLLLAAVWFQTSVPVAEFMKDPLVVGELAEECCSFYFGLVSNLGVMIWIAGAAVCSFASALLFRWARPKSEVVFFAAAAVFTLWLALDDLFMIHEDVLPEFGVAQPVTLGFYASLAAAYLLASWRRILALRPVLMALALALFGTSVLVDLLMHGETPVQVFVEDGSKFLGILAWTSFHLTAAYETIGAMIALAVARPE